MSCTKLAAAAALLMALLGTAQAANQVMYTVTPLKLVSNPKYSAATAINNQGQVVG